MVAVRNRSITQHARLQISPHTEGVDTSPGVDPAPDAVEVLVRHVEGQNHFVLSIGPVIVGRADYLDMPDGCRAFTHTEIHPGYGWRGLGTLLVRSALDQTRTEGLTIRPLCSFVRAFVERNRDYADLVSPAA